jgi:hypothetical protein
MGIVRDITDVAVEHFANLVDASRSGVLLPEVLLYVGHSVDSDSIEAEFLDHVFNPLDESLPNELVILVKVR